MKGSEVGWNLFLTKDAWIRDQEVGGYSSVCLHNRRKSAISGWAAPQWNAISGKGWWPIFFIKFKTEGLDAHLKV